MNLPPAQARTHADEVRETSVTVLRHNPVFASRAEADRADESYRAFAD